MHLFSRSVQFNGPFSQVMPHAAALRAYVADKSGLDVGLWSAVFGAPVGTCIYTARVDGLSGVQAMATSLTGDAKWEATWHFRVKDWSGKPHGGEGCLHGGTDFRRGAGPAQYRRSTVLTDSPSCLAISRRTA